jgi:hypothetical protein
MSLGKLVNGQDDSPQYTQDLSRDSSSSIISTHATSLKHLIGLSMRMFSSNVSSYLGKTDFSKFSSSFKYAVLDLPLAFYTLDRFESNLILRDPKKLLLLGDPTADIQKGYKQHSRRIHIVKLYEPDIAILKTLHRLKFQITSDDVQNCGIMPLISHTKQYNYRDECPDERNQYSNFSILSASHYQYPNLENFLEEKKRNYKVSLSLYTLNVSNYQILALVSDEMETLYIQCDSAMGTYQFPVEFKSVKKLLIGETIDYSNIQIANLETVRFIGNESTVYNSLSALPATYNNLGFSDTPFTIKKIPGNFNLKRIEFDYCAVIDLESPITVDHFELYQSTVTDLSKIIVKKSINMRDVGGKSKQKVVLDGKIITWEGGYCEQSVGYVKFSENVKTVVFNQRYEVICLLEIPSHVQRVIFSAPQETDSYYLRDYLLEKDRSKYAEIFDVSLEPRKITFKRRG